MEQIVGDAWTAISIKTRLHAKETTEIVLSNRNITKLVNFEFFENLEALWLNQNMIKEIKNLDNNFRIKHLVLSNNLIYNLEGSLTKMKFLKILLLDNNKLRNLDLQLNILKNFKFLENLNLFGNPLSEEPEYRNRVINNIIILKILDRHIITAEEINKSKNICNNYNIDKLNKYSSIMKKNGFHNTKILMTFSKSGMKFSPQNKRKNYNKIYENFSFCEREIWNKAKEINKLNNLSVIKNDISVDQKLNFLNSREVIKILNSYDMKGDNKGFLKRDDLFYLILDIKYLFDLKNFHINEDIMYYWINNLKNKIDQKNIKVINFSDIKKILIEIISFGKDLNNKVKLNENLPLINSNKRKDFFNIYFDGTKQEIIMLNENKLLDNYN
jgi:hypothetical protein